MGSNGFAGVDLDSVAPQQNSEAKAEETASPTSSQTEAAESQAPDTVDLDKLERFRFSGQDFTRDDFQKKWKEMESGNLRHSDYTKKSQEVSEARKYADNFDADLQAVIDNPQLIEQLKQIYPANYVAVAERVLNRVGDKNEVAGTAPAPKLPPEMEQALGEIREWKKGVQEQTIAATKSQLDSEHDRLGKKYPYADPDVVDVRVQHALDKGEKVTRENLGKILENAYKMHHEAVESRIKLQSKAKVEEQVKAGREARDVGAGGAIPSAPRKKYSKFNDITNDVLASFGGK